MKNITDAKKCTGCQACRLVCPKQCIAFAPDDEGFLIPRVDEELCVNCDKCVQCCPENNRTDSTENNSVRIIGARLKDDRLLRTSASGGVFVGIASKILETPGNAVFGCAYDDNLVARHACVTDISEIAPLQSSKYVQSDVGDTYLQAKTLLDNGKTVFYSGVPCQIGGLYAFLGRDYDNLITADLICHGVPSPLLFKRYLGWLGKKYGGKVRHYSFRDKEKKGWAVMTKVKTDKRSVNVEPYVDPYLIGFLANRTFREGCYACQYANSHRVADFTIGDFWGVENYHPEFFDSRGVSVIMMNTEKAESFFKTVEAMFDTIETSLKSILPRNSNLSSPSPRPSLRDAAYKDINNDGVDIFKNPSYKVNTRIKIKAYIKQLTPSKLYKLYTSLKVSGANKNRS